ncbi:hypothetical protein FRC10_007077 [Ceratobasidium sp. 414]|nr:hypothetical protein FRC10_007077 [Ceratobasidium sp. 414]
MQFGASAGGLGSRSPAVVATKTLALPPLSLRIGLSRMSKNGAFYLLPPTAHGPLASSTSAPAVPSMRIGSGLNQLLFASDSKDSLTLGSQRLSARDYVSPSTGRLLASPTRLTVPFTPAIVSWSSCHTRLLSEYHFSQSSGFLFMCFQIPESGPVIQPVVVTANSPNLQDMLAAVQPAPEPPVVKVSSSASAVKKLVVRIDSPQDQQAKKRKSGEKDSSEVETKPTLDEKTPESSRQKDKSSVPAKKPAQEKPSTWSPEQPKSTMSKIKKRSTSRRRSNTKLTVGVKAGHGNVLVFWTDICSYLDIPRRPLPLHSISTIGLLHIYCHALSLHSSVARTLFHYLRHRRQRAPFATSHTMWVQHVQIDTFTPHIESFPPPLPPSASASGDFCPPRFPALRRMSRYANSSTSTLAPPECCNRVVYTIADGSWIEATIRNYYRIVFALLRGSSSRRGLPLELVTYICRYAGFTSLHLNKSLSDHLQCQRFQSLSLPSWVRKSERPKTMNTVLVSGQISAQTLRTLGKVEIVATRSRGCRRRAPRGHWNNFSIKIRRQAGPNSNAEFGQDISEMTWPCFEAASKGRTDQRRAIIDQSHEIWDYFQPGDRIEVAQNDHIWNLPEHGYEVVIRVWDLWGPTSNVLALA